MGRRRTAWVASAAALATAAAVLVAGSAPAATVPRDRAARPPVAIGTWRVDSLGDGRYAVSWTSPTRLPMTSDRPTVVGPATWRLGVSTVAVDGRTVRATVVAPQRPDPARLDVVLSGDRLDEPGSDLRRRAASAAASAPLDLPGTTTLSDDPGVAGPYAVVSSDYSLPKLRVPGLPRPVEMVGHVVEPDPGAATGPRPLVLFMHGRHGVCYRPGHPRGYDETWPCRAPYQEVPSQLGYDYLQRLLASQGYATVSVRVNGVNAQDDRLADGGADARARVVRAHLDHWVDLAAAHQVDLSRVVLVGHSRGGEGVVRAAIQVPLSAPYRIVGLVLLAPTAFGSQTAPYVPTVTLLPFCDGDVSDLEGQRYTDAARGLAAADTSLKSSVLLMGANHNYFNTEWTPGTARSAAIDDWPGPARSACGSRDPQRLTAAQQRAVASAYVGGAVHLFAAADNAVLPLFDGSRARVDSQGSAQTLSHAVGGGRSVRSLEDGAGAAAPTGAETRVCRGDQNPMGKRSCARAIGYVAATPHWQDALVGPPTQPWLDMTWSQAGQSGGLDLSRPLDLTGRRLELRVITDPRTTTSVHVRLTDAGGASATLAPVGGGGVPALGTSPDVAKLWAQAVVVDPTGAAIDLSRVVRVELVADTARGRLWIADLSSAPATLPAVPATRLPTISIGSRRVREGSGGVKVVALPFTVHGTVAAAARFVVVTVGQAPGDIHRHTIDLAPGQTAGTIPIRYVADRRADYPRLTTQVSGWATSNAMTDDYVGSLTVVDDDPRPRVTVRPVHDRVVEGRPARWRIRLDRSADFDVSVLAHFVRGHGRQVEVDDLPASWTELYVGSAGAGVPLWRTNAIVFANLQPRARVVEVAVPTRRDGVDEPAERLTLRFRIIHKSYTSVVEVVDGR